LAAGLRPDQLGELKHSPDPLAAIEEVLFKGRDISIDWPQDGTTSLKYKAQRERRVPNSSLIFNGDQTQEILRHLGTHKGANLCLKCTKIHLAAGLRSDPLGELKRPPPDLLAAINGVLLLRGWEGRREGGGRGRDGKGGMWPPNVESWIRHVCYYYYY